MNYQLLIFLVLAGIFGIFGWRSRKVKGDKVGTIKKGFVVFASFILAIGSLWMSGVGGYVIPNLSSPLTIGAFATGGTGNVGGSGTDIPDSDVNVIGCDKSATITYTLAGQDAYNGSATGGTHRYRLDGGTWTTVADAGTVSGSPYQTLDVLWENGATTGYFSKYETYSLPCGVKTLSPKLSINGSITSTAKDDTDTVIALATNNQTLAVGDLVDASVRLKGTVNRDFPYGFDAVVDFNETELDAVKLMQNGVELPLGIQPQSYSDYFGGESSTITYFVPALISNKELVFDVNIDVDDTNNPAPKGYGESNITITYFPRNMFVNDDKGGIAEGPASQDEDQALTKAAGYVSTIYYD